jgi:hypothetical protein
VCEGVRLTEKKDCRLPTCWNTIDYYDDAQPSFAATTDLDLQVGHLYCSEDMMITVMILMITITMTYGI